MVEMDKYIKKHMLQEDDLDRFNSFQDIIDGMNVAMWRWDINQGVLTPFFGLEKLLGFHDIDQITRASFWLNQWHPEDKKMIMEKVNDCFNKKETEFDVIQRIKHQNGEYVWFYTKTKIEYADQDNTILTGVSINIDQIEKTREALFLEKESYSTFIKATQAATWIWNVQTKETIFDEHWAKILGYSLDDLKPIGLITWEQLVHPDDLEMAYRDIQKAFDKKTEFYVSQYRMKHKSGDYIWISDRGQVISWTEDGKPLIMVGIHLDVTDFKKLELEFQSREKHFRYLVNSSYDIIYTLDVEGQITFASSAWKRILGHDVNETLKNTYRDFIHPDDNKRLDSFFSHIYHSQESFEIKELRLKDSKDNYRWFNTNASPMTDDDNNVVGFVGTLRDITEHKDLENQLALERDLFKKTLLSVGDAVISTNSKGIIVVINSNALKLLGLTEKEAKYQYIWDVLKIYFDDDDDKLHQKILKPKKEIYVQHATIFNKRGRRISIEMSVSPIKDKGKTQEGIAIVFRDISEKIKKQQEIEFLSYHDYLTGLYNRRFMDQLIQDLDKDRYLPLGVMIFDVNNLKEMNDEHGHQSGDDLLKKVCRIIESNMDSKDYLGRMGGDEFLLVMPNTTEDDVHTMKHVLIDAFHNETLRGSPISVALGYAIKADADHDIYEIMRTADDYMYLHKKLKNT